MCAEETLSQEILFRLQIEECEYPRLEANNLALVEVT